MRALAFTVPGEVRGKGRPRIVKIGGFSRMAADRKTATYENLVALVAMEAMTAAGPAPAPTPASITTTSPAPKTATFRPLRMTPGTSAPVSWPGAFRGRPQERADDASPQRCPAGPAP